MKAIGYKKAGPISDPESLIEFEQAKPKVEAHDLLVEVKGISVNPVDVKVRAMMPPEEGAKVIGYDASGIVKEVGHKVSRYKVGDEVFYAGDFTRPGPNSELHVVDERIVGRKPQSLGFAEAAGFPLTTITAWEILFDCFGIKKFGGGGNSILIIGGAGGVGSILIQLAKKLTNLAVIATASRPETVQWVHTMGADYVLDHRQPLAHQVELLGFQPKYVVSLNGTQQHFSNIVELIKPRGHITIIDDPESIDIASIKMKALSFSWEFMFTRSMFKTFDMDKQYHLLNKVSAMIDEGEIISTVTNNLGQLTVDALKQAHALQESGRVIGKNVLEGF